MKPFLPVHRMTRDQKVSLNLDNKMANQQENQVEQINKLMQDQALLLSETSEQVYELFSNLSGLFGDLVQIADKNSTENEQNSKDSNDLSNFLHQQSNYIDNVHKELKNLLRRSKEAETQVDLHRGLLDKAQQEAKSISETLAVANDHQHEMEQKMIEGRSFTAVVGSTISQMLWKSSKSEDTINTFIREDMVRDFIVCSNVALDAFLRSYSEGIPESRTSEFKFLLSILGINVNILAHESGRDFVLRDEAGVKFIKTILENVYRFRIPDAHLLKRLSFIILYDTGICKKGAELIGSNMTGMTNICNSLDMSHPEGIHHVALLLLKTLLEEIQTEAFINILKQLIKREDLEYLMKSANQEIKDVSTLIAQTIVDEMVFSSQGFRS